MGNGDDSGEIGTPSPLSGYPRREARIRLWIIGILAVLGFAVYFGEKYIREIKPNLDKLFLERDAGKVNVFEKGITDVLEEYGIRGQWVKQSPVVMEGNDTVRMVWSVHIPTDVPVASLAHEIGILAEQQGGKTMAVEDAKTGQVNLHVLFDGFVRTSVLFVPTAGLRREEGIILFLVDGLDDAGGAELDRFLEAVDPIGCILTPNRKSAQIHDNMHNAGKDVILHIHVSVEGDKGNRFSLSETFDAKELESRVKRILKSFSGARSYFLTMERNPGPHAHLIDTLLGRQGLKKLDASRFIYMDRRSESLNPLSRINDLATTAVRDGAAVGVMKLEDGTVRFLQEQSVRLRKRGLDVVPVQKLIAWAGARFRPA
ncbi:MAG: hypothetical protein QHI48_06615 [Bacteroidota bacterium]|nr:hypothetical protein [Bacteroidota bacterium]